MAEAPTRSLAARLVARFAARVMLVMLAGMVGMGMAGALDLNRANRSELEQLPRIGVEQAEVILQERERNGAFASWDDFRRRVPGYGKKSIERFKSLGVTIEGRDAAAARIDASPTPATGTRP